MSNNNIFRNKWIITIAGVLIIGCCVLTVATGGFILWIDRLADEISGIVSCDEFTYDFLKVDFPASASVLREQCTASFNPTYKVTFTMTADDLSLLQQQEYLAEIETWPSDPSDSWYDESVWQRVEADLRQQGASLDTALYGWYGDGIVAMFVVIDTSSPQQYFVHYSASYVD